MRIEELADDKREIYQVVKQFGGEMDFYTVGDNKVTKIVAYRENGQMAAVPWFAVYKGDNIVYRMDATNCVIVYKQDWSEEN